MEGTLLKPFILLSAVGFVLSFIVHVCSLLGQKVPYGKLAWGLHFGIFVVWFPVVSVSKRLTENFKQKYFWKAALRGCPEWLKRMTYFSFGYAIINFFIFFILDEFGNTAIPKEILEFRGFSGHWMAFYSAALAVLYSAVKAETLDQIRRCMNGHAVFPLANYCEECGAPVKAQK